MMCIAFLVGLPVFFEVGFVLLIPIAFNVAKRTGTSMMLVGIPMVAGLSVVHGLIPPHPAALLAVTAYNADIGHTIFYALIVGIPTAIIAGPLFSKLIAQVRRAGRRQSDGAAVHRTGRASADARTAELRHHAVHGVAAGAADADRQLGRPDLPAEDRLPNDVLHLIGHPDMALLLAVLLSFYTFGSARGFNRERS